MTAVKSDQRVYHALDGLRGVAALFVAMRHTSFFHRAGIHGGYLAVDLFFVLSGFVIAHAYEKRLASGLPVGRFLVARYLRLWPVYALGALVGLAAAAMQALPGRDNLSLGQVAATAPFALAMLPGPPFKASIYPVNSVAWSLALELLVNAAYALAWRPLRRPVVLAGALALFAAWLAVAAVAYGKLDVGFAWTNAAGGAPRVLFSFTAGLAVYRLHKSGLFRLRLPAWLPLAALPVLLWVQVDPVVYPLVCVLAIFPAIVFAAAAAPTGPWLVATFRPLGLVSYPLYALHKPVGEILAWLLHHQAPWILAWGPWIGVPYIAVLAGVCLLVERFYDRPVRRTLTEAVDRLFRMRRRRQTGDALAAERI